MKNIEKQRNSGFTLIELIVVIAIIAVISAIMVPNIINWVGTAQETACTFQRSKLKQELILQATLGNVTSGNIQTLADSYNITCKQGGKYTCRMSNGFITVRCKEHSAGGDNGLGKDESGSDVALFDFGTAAIVSLTDMKVQGAGDNLLKNSDSSCPEPNNYTYKVVQYLEDNGMDLSISNINYWSYVRQGDGKYHIFWSEVDITKYLPGTNVLTMKYNQKDGTYTVGTMKIVQKTQDDTGKIYNVLSDSGVGKFSECKYYDDSKTDNEIAEMKKDYSQMYSYYLQVKNDHGILFS